MASGFWSRLRLRVAEVLAALAGLCLRAAFFLLLLTAVVVAWNWHRQAAVRSPIRTMALLGQWFYIGVVGVQLTLVLVAAPAATAGAICLDRTEERLRTCS